MADEFDVTSCKQLRQPDEAAATAASILPYTDALAPHFRSINAAWIEALFTLEPHHREVLDDPRRFILDPGGTILFAAHPEHGIVGAGALMPTAPGCMELTKMGVLEQARGSGAGAALLAALIERARANPGVDTLYLLTNARCEAAVHLYEKAGFVHDPAIMARFGSDYCRCDVAMNYPLGSGRPMR